MDWRVGAIWVQHVHDILTLQVEVVHVDGHPNDRFLLSGGRQMVASVVGRLPIDHDGIVGGDLLMWRTSRVQGRAYFKQKVGSAGVESAVDRRDLVHFKGREHKGVVMTRCRIGANGVASCGDSTGAMIAHVDVNLCVEVCIEPSNLGPEIPPRRCHIHGYCVLRFSSIVWCCPAAVQDSDIRSGIVRSS